MKTPLKRHGLPGVLIAFEGIDGCGKGTQIERLHARLKAEGYGDRVVRTKQPGDTKLGRGIRDLLFHSVRTHEMDADACTLLYLTAHLQMMRDIVWPALHAGKIVIADRWDAFSGTIFGSHALYEPAHPDIQTLRWKLAGCRPDLTLFLQGDPSNLLARATNRAETHEAGKAWAEAQTLERLQEAYRELFRHQDGVVIMDAELSPDTLACLVWWNVQPLLRKPWQQQRAS